MNPFVAKPGETIRGIGFDFATRLAAGETIASSIITADSGLTVDSTSNSSAIALANISIAANQADADLNISYTVTGSAGSVRKATRIVWIRAQSE